MIKLYITLDSSVIVAALKKDEEKHKECRAILEKIVNGEFVVFEPYTVLVEVVAAIVRRTGSKKLAKRVKNDLENIDMIYFLEIIKSKADDAANIAVETGVRGMDAVVIQTAKENNAVLVTLDKEMIKKAKGIVKTKYVDELV